MTNVVTLAEERRPGPLARRQHHRAIAMGGTMEIIIHWRAASTAPTTMHGLASASYAKPPQRRFSPPPESCSRKAPTRMPSWSCVAPVPITTLCAPGLGRRRVRATVALRRILMLPRCLSKGSDQPVLHGRFWAGKRPSNIGDQGMRVLLDTRDRRNHTRVLPDRPRISHAGKVLRFARDAGHSLI
jgi:hypothetical protein